jgi:hypothetical protein
LTGGDIARIDGRRSHEVHGDGACLEIHHGQIRQIGPQRVHLKQLVGNIQHARMIVVSFSDKDFVVGRINEKIIFDSICKSIVVTIGKNKCSVRVVRIRHFASLLLYIHVISLIRTNFCFDLFCVFIFL